MYVSVEKAKKYYAVSISTLRRWDEAKKIKVIRTQGGHRRFYIPEKGGRRKIVYCRVSSSKQKSNLQNQIKYMSEKYKDYEIISDIGSGINFKRKGFNSILDSLFSEDIKEVVVSSKDRFSRFGFEMFQNIFSKFGALLKTDSSKEFKSKEQELAEDILSIITVFTARYHGSRKYETSKNEENKNLSN